MDANKLEKYNSSFVTNDLKNQETDIIYKIKDKKIFFLIEHQTKIDYSMPYRILQYENEIMKSAIDYKKLGQKGYKLPLIISTVLYTGKRKWNANTYIKECQEKLENAEELAFAKYNIVDINDMNNSELFEEKSIISKILILEKSKNNEELIININKIINKIK